MLPTEISKAESEIFRPLKLLARIAPPWFAHRTRTRIALACWIVRRAAASLIRVLKNNVDVHPQIALK